MLPAPLLNSLRKYAAVINSAGGIEHLTGFSDTYDLWGQSFLSVSHQKKFTSLNERQRQRPGREPASPEKEPVLVLGARRLRTAPP